MSHSSTFNETNSQSVSERTVTSGYDNNFHSLSISRVVGKSEISIHSSVIFCFLIFHKIFRTIKLTKNNRKTMQNIPIFL
jgi:hypothetical protein